jgi:hypothetical protein
MAIKRWIAIILGFFLICFAFDVAAETLTGKQVMEKQKELHKVRSEIGDEIMLLVDKKGGKEKRQVRRYAKEIGDDLHRYLIVFLKPADIRATALLTWEQEERDNDQWLYMPAHKKMQRIAKGSKKSYFMGTDFTYEDMEPEDLDSFNYTILRTEKITHDKQEFECYVIEAVPANKKKARVSGYKRRILWVEKAHLTTLKIEFYDRRNRLQKTQTNHDLKNIAGTVWRPNKTFMKHQEKNHKTLTLITKRVINQPIKSNVFTERFILSGKHVQ